MTTPTTTGNTTKQHGPPQTTTNDNRRRRQPQYCNAKTLGGDDVTTLQQGLQGAATTPANTAKHREGNRHNAATTANNQIKTVKTHKLVLLTGKTVKAQPPQAAKPLPFTLFPGCTQRGPFCQRVFRVRVFRFPFSPCRPGLRPKGLLLLRRLRLIAVQIPAATRALFSTKQKHKNTHQSRHHAGVGDLRYDGPCAGGFGHFPELQ